MAESSNLNRQARDGFERYYAEKLWEWIPSIYRHEDGLESNPNPHVLRALVEMIALHAAIARRDIDRVWEDQFIDTCDDWAVPYIGDLVGTRLLNGFNREGRRIDVAKTIFYRRRKGTPAVLQALIQDIARWEGVAVESFRRLGRTVHRLDCEPAQQLGPVTETPSGGTADLRNARAKEVVDGPFDDFAHTPDFRRHRGFRGRYNITKLNLHLYRLQVYEVEFATPFHLSDDIYTMDPSGRDVLLFAPDTRVNQDRWQRVEEWQVPKPIPCQLLSRQTDLLVPSAIAVHIGETQVDGSDFLSGNLARGPIAGTANARVIVDPTLGKLQPIDSDEVSVPRYHYGFSGEIGAGTYGRRRPDELAVDTTFPADSVGAPPIDVTVPSQGLHVFPNNRTFRIGSDVEDISDLHVRARDGARPYVTLRSSGPDNTFRFAADETHPSPCFVLDGLWLGFESTTPLVDEPVRRTIVFVGTFERITICNCTLDPGGERVHPDLPPGQDQPTRSPISAVDIEIHGQVGDLVIDSSIVASIRESTEQNESCSIGKITIRDSIVQSIDRAASAIASRRSSLDLQRVTVFGDVSANRIDASDCLFQGTVQVTNNQQSCVRFCAATAFSTEHFESHVFPGGLPDHFFTSLRFGQPGFAQLSRTAPDEIARGAENRSEMGVFNSLIQPIKQDDLDIKVREFMPFGLIPQFVIET